MGARDDGDRDPPVDAARLRARLPRRCVREELHARGGIHLVDGRSVGDGDGTHLVRRWRRGRAHRQDLVGARRRVSRSPDDGAAPSRGRELRACEVHPARSLRPPMPARRGRDAARGRRLPRHAALRRGDPSLRASAREGLGGLRIAALARADDAPPRRSRKGAERARGACVAERRPAHVARSRRGSARRRRFRRR